jgi:phosphate uptake regulator
METIEISVGFELPATIVEAFSSTPPDLLEDLTSRQEMLDRLVFNSIGKRRDRLTGNTTTTSVAPSTMIAR